MPAAMYVCICSAVTDRDIRNAVREGARSLSDLSMALGVATCCGCCADCAKSLVVETRSDPPGGDD